ncbi:hypothetical protein [Amycolatopsis sp. NPDC051371]|uniref:hypothetical protein n=1 Tax=Amycolatopsis sp. NPDC051371 TaxID=3155800 RepID=UPI00342D01AA
MRTMYDAVTARNILNHDRSPALVAGYIDKIKLEPWSASDWALFPNAKRVTIVKKASTNAGHVLDVEPGDATPAQAPGWAAMRRRSGFAYPTIYCNRSTWPLVKQAFIDQGVAPPLYWIATATNVATIPAGAIAAQYRLDYQGVDVSVVADHWPGVDDDQEDDMPDPNEYASAVVNALMSNQIEVEPITPGVRRFVPFSALLRYDDDHATVTRAGVTTLLARSQGASADEIAAKLLPALTSALASAVAGLDVSELNSISDEDAQRIAQAVTDHAASLLGGGA